MCERFGLGRLIRREAVPGTRNRSSRVRTDRGQWLARVRYPGYASPERVRFDHEALRFLAAAGVPVIPPIAERGGASFWQRSADELWEVYPFVKGQHLREGAPAETAALGRALAAFHRAGASFPLRCNKLGPRGETDPAAVEEAAARIEAESPDARKAVAAYRARVREAAARLPAAAFAALPQTLIHGDVQPANVLVRESAVRALVDLDWCALRPRLYDVCWALLFCCGTGEEPAAPDIWGLTRSRSPHAPSVSAFLQAYEPAAGPLTPAEREALGPQLALSWCHSRLRGALKVEPADRRRFLDRGAGAAAADAFRHLLAP